MVILSDLKLLSRDITDVLLKPRGELAPYVSDPKLLESLERRRHMILGSLARVTFDVLRQVQDRRVVVTIGKVRATHVGRLFHFRATGRRVEMPIVVTHVFDDSDKLVEADYWVNSGRVLYFMGAQFVLPSGEIWPGRSYQAGLLDPASDAEPDGHF